MAAILAPTWYPNSENIGATKLLRNEFVANMMNLMSPDQTLAARRDRLTLTLGAPVRGQNLFGREQEIDSLWKRVASDHVLLLAPRRVGKTSIMYHLLDQPARDWDVSFLNVEDCSHPGQFICALADELRKKGRFREFLDSLAPLSALREALGRVKKVGPVELDAPAAVNWRKVGREIFHALEDACKGSQETKVLIIIDEFPYFIRRIAAIPGGGPTDAEDFLSWFRNLRQDPRLSHRVRYVLGGSIGLAGILSRLRLSALANDILPVYLGPFNHDTALRFLLEAAISSLLGPRSDQLKHMVERLHEALPQDAERRLADELLRTACQRPEGVSRATAERLSEQVVAEADVREREQRLLSVLETLEHDGYLTQVAGPEDEAGDYIFQSELLRRYWKRRYPLRTK